jgi:hypothetical protein
MPDFLRPENPHTHNALDDAVEQGELFANLLGWAIRRRVALNRPEVNDQEPSWLAAHILPIA